MALTPEQKQKLLDAGYSVSKIAAYEKLRSPATPQAQSGFAAAVKDIPNDITGAFQNSVSAVSKGIQNANDVRSRVIRGETTPAAGTLQTIGGGLKAGAEVVGQGVLGLAKTFTSPRTEQKVQGAVERVAAKIAETEPVQNIALRYASLTPEQKRNLDAALGVAEGVATVAGAGPVVKAARAGLAPVADLVGAGAQRVAPAAGSIASKSVDLPARGISEIQGALTGTSGETIRQAFGAARRGGKELEEFTAALRGNTTPEQLVNQLREGTDKINAEKSQRFGEMLKQIGDKTVDTSRIRNEVIGDLRQIGVKVNADGTLDLSNSKFRTVPNAANKLQKMFDEVNRLGPQQTVQGIDTSRQALGALLLEGDDASARTANLAITNAINRVRNAGKTVDGYGEALAQFGDDSEFLSEISRALSSGDQATIDTAYRKLATALKTNNEQRRNLIMELDEATDGFILSSVAGQQLSEELPRGLFRQIAAGIAGASVVTGGLSAGLLPALIFASPRATGEVLRALGIATSKIDPLIKAFTKVRETLNTPVKPPPSPSGHILNPFGDNPRLPEPASVVKNMDARDLKIVRSYLDVVDGKARGTAAYIDASINVDDLLRTMKINPDKISDQAKTDFLVTLRDFYEQQTNQPRDRIGRYATK